MIRSGRMFGFSKGAVEAETDENDDGTVPLSRGHRILEQNDGSQDSEQLARCCNDRAWQRAEVGHCFEDKVLK